MTNLIHRLEAAEGPSRELDVEIHCAVTGRITHKQLPRGYTMADQGADYKNERMARSDFIHRDRGPAPAYTASLDAAVSLVPEGWWWRIEQWGFAKPDQRQIFRADTFQPKQEITAHAPTPALALCIAARKARKAENG